MTIALVCLYYSIAPSRRVFRTVNIIEHLSVRGKIVLLGLLRLAGLLAIS